MASGSKGATMTKDDAIARLIEIGATHEKKEDLLDDTKSGWWLDTVFLAPYSDPKSALAAIEG